MHICNFLCMSTLSNILQNLPKVAKLTTKLNFLRYPSRTWINHKILYLWTFQVPKISTRLLLAQTDSCLFILCCELESKSLWLDEAWCSSCIEHDRCMKHHTASRVWSWLYKTQPSLFSTCIFHVWKRVAEIPNGRRHNPWKNSVQEC